MRKLSVREAREDLARILREVEEGQEVQIMRRGYPVARMTRPEVGRPGFRSRAELRQELPVAQEPAADAARAVREAERY